MTRLTKLLKIIYYAKAIIDRNINIPMYKNIKEKI